MNTRFGLGTPPTMGLSEPLDLQFYKKVFFTPMYRIGIAHTISKNELVPPNWDEINIPMIGCIGQLTLFEDPAMPMWSGFPIYQNVLYSDSIGIGFQTFTVTVTNNQGPVEGALVCIWSKLNEIYETQTTDHTGTVYFNISPEYYDIMWVTSTFINHIPYEGYTIITGVSSLDDKKYNTKPSVSIYPMINNGSLIINLIEYSKSNIKISILDQTGRKLEFTKYLNKNSYNINLKKFNSGVYIMYIYMNETKIRKKFVIFK